MKESSDSDRNVTATTAKGFTNPFTTNSPQHLERLCPFCESSSIVEKTSLSGSMPNYNASILTDSVLARASPHAKSPMLSSPILSSSNRTPVTPRKAEKEFVIQIVRSHEEKEEEEVLKTPTPPMLSTSHEKRQETPPLNDDMEVTEVTQVKTSVNNDSDPLEVIIPVVVPAPEEVTSEAPCEEPVEVKYDEIPEISFETSIGSLPNQSFRDHETSFNKLTHNRSRSMDLHTKRESSYRALYSRHLHPDETETSYTASLMEYATHKKLLKSSEASLESSLSISGAATQSDSLVPGKSYTHSSSDSRSVTPTGIPYSLDDPLYIHNSFKLYLELKVFQDDEEFKLLLRVSEDWLFSGFETLFVLFYYVVFCNHIWTISRICLSFTGH